MALSQDLISKFAKLTNDKKEDNGATLKGTYKKINGIEYVQIDGSDIWTPVESTVEAENGEKVKVTIKDHTATIIGNISSPSARNKSVQDLKDEVDEYGNTIQQMDNTIIQQGNSIIQMNNTINQQGNTINQHNNAINQQGNAITQLDNSIKQQNNEIDQMNNIISQHGDNIDSMNNTITQHGNNINQMNNTIQQQGNIINQQQNTINQQGNIIDQQNNTIIEHNSNIAILNSGFSIVDGVLRGLSSAVINSLETNHLDARYANIDFSNIQIAAISNLFTESGIIKDLVVQAGKITGELVGVTIKGDLIEANTVVADKLVVHGSDGLFYKLNIEGETVATEQTNENSLNGSVITAQSITADKISVTDLVAFGATIGGYHIDQHKIYSGAKSSATNTTRGVYLGDDGEFAIGDANNLLRFFKDQNNQYKLEIRASDLYIGLSNKTVQDELNEIRDETTTLLQIESSRGTVFKNNAVSTVLSVAIYRGSDRITDMTTLRSKMGSTVYLQWKWKRMNDSDYGIISSDDPRIGQDGFMFTLSPQDVDTKVTFLCELIV